MADRKISELTNITGANLADGDELVVVDASASETKAITFGEFKNALDTSTGFVSITGDTMTGDLILNSDPSVALGAATKQYVDNGISGLVDSAPATLDTLNELAAALGDDANFSTTVTNSIATKLPLAGGTMTGDVGHGDNVKATFGASSDLQIYHSGGTSFIDEVTTGQSLKIRADNLQLERHTGETFLTASNNAAVDVYYNNAVRLSTTSSGIDVTGTVATNILTVDAGSGTSVTSTGNNIEFDRDAGFSFIDQIGTGGIRLRTTASYTNRMDIANNGDISFYEDTGTTAKLIWDASDEALEFGDNVKAVFGAGNALTVYHDGSNSFVNDQGVGDLRIQTNGNRVNLYDQANSNVMAHFNTGGSVDLYHNGSEKLSTTSTGISVTGSVELNGWTVTESGGSLYFATGGSNKMKLDASGNLQVVGSVDANATIS